MIADFLARQNDALARLRGRSWPLKWLFAPSGNAFEFALRNTIASLFALGIAFWMELGEPQWAAMTVWITAQGSRGESLSKGRWRLVGTLLGMIGAVALVSAFPQAPWLFIPALALWAGICTGLATLLQNFRAYAFVLAAYTCAIIATSALSAPDHVFEIAMARGTYIVLGVVCEMVAGLVFSASLAVKARRAMRGWLIEGIGAASLVISDVLDGAAPSEKAIRAVFSRTLNLNEQLEFTVVEVGRSDHAVACAYATIGILSKIVSRGLGMQARLSTTLVVSDKARTALHEVAGFIKGLTERLDNAGALAALRQDLATLQSRYDILYRQSETDPEGGGSFTPDDGIILHGLRLILEEYETLLIYFEARPTEAVTPSRFRLRRVMHFHAAFHNAMRSAAAICLAGLVWEVTAWPQGASFISFIAVVVGRFATTDNTVLVSNRFFYGACLAAVASILPVFFLIPTGSGFEALIVALAPLMFIGGLAARNPATATAAGAYNTFLPALIGLDNHSRMDELTWFNATIALLLGLGAGVLVFRCIPAIQYPSGLRAAQEACPAWRAAHLRPRAPSASGEPLDRPDHAGHGKGHPLCGHAADTVHGTQSPRPAIGHDIGAQSPVSAPLRPAPWPARRVVGHSCKFLQGARTASLAYPDDGGGSICREAGDGHCDLARTSRRCRCHRPPDLFGSAGKSDGRSA